MVSGEDRVAKGAEWLRRLQEAADLKESLVDYCTGGGEFKPGEAYQWKRNLRSAGRWPGLCSRSGADESINLVRARTTPPTDCACAHAMPGA